MEERNNRQLNVLIACEESQRICTAMRALGHNAFSCDILECSGNHPEWHIKGDCLPILNGDCTFTTESGKLYEIQGVWDLVIAHPPCTYLSNCQSPLYDRNKFGDKYVDDRIAKREEAIRFFMNFTDLKAQYVAIENPIGIIGKVWRRADQTIQPYWFGDGFRKRTGLWLKNLPKLQKTNVVPFESYDYIGKDGKKKTDVRWRIQGKRSEWARMRSKTFPGIAKAIAEQWTRYILSQPYASTSRIIGVSVV